MLRRVTPLRALVALQLALVAVAGAATVAGLPLWSLVDEGAHFDYVQKVAEEGRIPVLGRDLVSEEVQAIADRSFPGPPRTDQRDAGLAGQSYEGVQPPLYYLLAAPPSLAASDHEVRAHLLRGLNLVLLFGTIFLAWRLALAVLGRRRALAGFALALTFLLWPGVVVRAITVSNAGLEIFMATATILALWLALTRRDGRALLAAGVLVGLALLTSLKIAYVAPVLLGVALRLALLPDRAERVSPGTALAAVALPALVLAPWMAFNLHHYDALSTLDAGRDLQRPYLEPAMLDFALADLPAKNRVLLGGVLPEEWWRAYLEAPVRIARDLSMAVVVGVPLLLGLALPRGQRGRAFGVLAAPLLIGIVVINVTLIGAGWDTAGPRYLYPALPAFGVFAALAIAGRRRSERALAWPAAAITVLLAGAWAYMAATTPYTP